MVILPQKMKRMTPHYLLTQEMGCDGQVGANPNCGSPTVEVVSQRLWHSMAQDDFAGDDPFDFLNSPVSRVFLFRHPLVRLAWLQLGKRSPINLRRVLAVPKRRNPKGVALVILGLIARYQVTAEPQLLNHAASLADWLVAQSCRGDSWKHHCWGYHFDWQARAFYVPAGKPNMITTYYVSAALFALGEMVGSDEFQAVALDSSYFMVKDLLQTDRKQLCFSYIPGESTLVHNASLWGAAWAAKAGVALKDDRLQEVALETARTSVDAQREQGAWVYGERSHHQFIDGFHTGYNLEALDMLRKALQFSEFDGAIACGLDYYRTTFFSEDGTANYYHDNPYPLDMHSAVQGVITLLKVNADETSYALAERIINRAIQTLYLEKKGQFIYQRHRWLSNSINYMRWTQAWAYYGLNFFDQKMAEQS